MAFNKFHYFYIIIHQVCYFRSTVLIVECCPIAIVFCETNKSFVRFSHLLSVCPYDPECEDGRAFPSDGGSFFCRECRKFYAASFPPSTHDWFLRVNSHQRAINRAKNLYLLLWELLSCKLVLLGCYL